MQVSNFTKGALLAATGGIGWGISGVCSQFLFSEYSINPSWLTSVRMILSGIILLLIASTKEKEKIFKIFLDKIDRRWLLAFAVLGLLLCQYSFLAAINFSNSGTATVLQSLNVVMMALIMAIWNRSKMEGRQITAILLAILGTYLIATNGNASEMVLSMPGLIWGLLSAIGVITYTLLSRGIIQKWGNILVTGWGMLLGGIILGITVQVWNLPSNLDLFSIVIIMVIVVIGTAGGFSLFLQGVKFIGPVKATLIGCIEPATATILSSFFLGTRFGFIESLGFFAIIITVFLSIKNENSNVLTK